MGLTWAAGGFLVGFAIEMVHNVWPTPIVAMVDIWPAALALPAFFGGLVFSTVLGIAGRRQRLDELTVPRFAAWGAVGGVIASLIPAALVALGLATPNIPLWQITAALLGPLTIGSAIAAAGSLALARMSEDRELLDAGRNAADVGLTEQEARELLGG
jgi:hypothetical protein